jgi:hypothetical protein
MELLLQAAMRSGERIDNKGDVFVIILRNSIINEIGLLFMLTRRKDVARIFVLRSRPLV